MTTDDFSHFVITRFNIRVSGFGPEKMDSPEMDASFLEERLALFQKYCVPSVHFQTNKNFNWICYFDSQTDLHFLNRVIAISNGPISVVPVLVNGYEDMLNDTRQRIRDSLPPYCITTRLDNDDLLSADYIETVQNLFVKQGRTLINFTQGFEIDLTHHFIKKWNLRFANQFTSLIEERLSPELLTIYSLRHNALPHDLRIINYGNGAKWAYTRHELNYSRQKINARPVFFSSALNAFPSLKGRINISFLSTVKYTCLWFPVMLKKRLASLLKRK